MSKDHLQPFLSRHVSSQISNTQKLCYRHRPDLIKNRGPDEFNVQQVQKVRERKKNIERMK
jgi:F-box/WD-40 domain protein MET30